MNEYEKEQIKEVTRQYKEVIKKSMQKISDLKNKKVGKFKNILLKIISLGLYDWNRKIDKKIFGANETISFFTDKIRLNNKLLDKYNDNISPILNSKECDDFRKKINLVDLQNSQSLTTSTKQNSPKI
ncbi:hypothetical protein [Spiroplasma endosymbiont of Dasysyrphus albostriatus]|uniref:hypothetical protein n=1 Tax=Spiroplasma endosymbiont of Dasysyrphus albostriatus TaxID=3066299 RepID=UPI0030D083AE